MSSRSLRLLIPAGPGSPIKRQPHYRVRSSQALETPQAQNELVQLLDLDVGDHVVGSVTASAESTPSTAPASRAPLERSGLVWMSTNARTIAVLL
jgi:hypothetical protein